MKIKIYNLSTRWIEDLEKFSRSMRLYSSTFNSSKLKEDGFVGLVIKDGFIYLI